MKDKSVKRTLSTMCLTIILLLIFVIGIVAVYSVKSMAKVANRNYEQAVKEGYQAEIKAEVQASIKMIEAEYEKSQAGLYSEEEAKQKAIELVREMRYGDDDKGYFWIDDTDYQLVMHPILSDEEGTNRYELEDQNGVKIVQKIIETATSSEKEGFNEFYFTKDDGVTVAPKIAYSKLFEPWNWVVSTGNYVDDMQAKIETTSQLLNQRGQFMLLIILGVGIVVAVGAALLARNFSNSILVPLNEVQQLANRLATGDLRTPIALKSNNELGKTAGALDEAQAQMKELIAQIGHTSDSLQHAVSAFTKNFFTMNHSIESLSSSVNQITANMNTQAQSTSAASKNIEDMGNNIEDNAAEIATLNMNAQKIQSYTKESMTTFDQLIHVNDQTKANIDTMYTQTESTNQSVIKINEAATLISQIADQTNLLSLNASIEAARAGEAGKGFSVVAGEIGSLAVQSAAAAQEINGILSELTSNSSQSVAIMHQINETSNLQVSSLKGTKATFDALSEAIDAVTISIENIANKMQSIALQKQHIVENIDILNGVATDNASEAEETAAMAQELQHMVDDSSQIVEKLEENTTYLNKEIQTFHF